MNKIYSTIWSKALGQIVVASELAKSGKKGSKAAGGSRVTRPSRRRAVAVAAATALVGGLGFSAIASADLNVSDGTNNTTVDTSSSSPDTLEFAGDGNILVTLDDTDPKLTFGLNDDVNIANNLTVGSISLASGGTLSFGSGPSVSSAGIDAGSKKISNVADGSANSDAATYGQVKAAKTEVQAGDNITVTSGTGADGQTQYTVATKDDLDLGNNGSVTINGNKYLSSAGLDANGQTITNVDDGNVASNSSQAINGGQLYDLLNNNPNGVGLKYFHANSTAADSRAIGDDSIAIGPESASEGKDSFAAGHETQAKGASSTALGHKAVAVGDGALAGGHESTAVGKNSTSLGAATDPRTLTKETDSNGHLTSVEGIAVTATGGNYSDITAINGVTVNGAQAEQIFTQMENGGNVAAGQAATALGLANFASGTNSIAAGSRNIASGQSSVAVGSSNRASGDDSVAIGHNAQANSSSSMAIGNGAQANQPDAVALGTHAGQGTGTTNSLDQVSFIAIGKDSGKNVVGKETIAIGVDAGSNVGSSGARADNNIAIGTQAGSSMDGNRNVSIGYQANMGAGSFTSATVIGSQAMATGDYAAAFGNEAKAGLNAVAVGSGATSDDFGVALGASAQADNGLVAIGQGSTALLSDANTATPVLSIGGTANKNVVSVGNTATGLQRRIINVAPGADGTDAVNVAQLESVLGADWTSGNVTIPSDKHYFSVNDDGTPQANYGNTGASGTNASAIGPNALTDGDSALALGDHTTANKDNATALGNHVSAGGQYSTALGSNHTQAFDEATVAIGSNAQAKGTNSVAIGTESRTNDQGVGTTVNNAIAMGTDARATADDAIAQGHGSRANHVRSIAQGKDAHAFNDDAQAYGTSSEASGTSSVAMGTSATASGTDTYAMGHSATAGGTATYALGQEAEAKGTNTLSVGTSSYVEGESAGAFGDDNTVTGHYSYAVGNGNTVGPKNTFVLGNGVNAGQANSVVLGNASTDRAATEEKKITLYGKTRTFAGPGSAAKGVVSVGAVGKERQIINVAAGKISAGSTDAVNGSQLYQTNQAVNDFAGDMATYLGGGASLGPNGKVLQPTYNVLGEDYHNVGDAIAAATTHFYSVSSTDTGADNYNNKGATKKNALAAGVGASATGTSAVAVGDTAKAVDKSSIAIGHTATANQQRDIAIGDSAKTDIISGGTKAQLDNVAIGHNAQALGGTAIAIGNGAEATGTSKGSVNSSIAIGNTAKAQDSSSVALGSSANTEVGANHAAAIGPGAAIGKNSYSAVAIGNSAKVASNASRATAIGSNAEVLEDAKRGVAIGERSQASESDAIAIGSQAVASNSGDVALGAGSTTAAQHTGTFTLDGSTAAGLNSGAAVVSVGTASHERQIQNVAPGVISDSSTDAVNGSQLYATNTVVTNLGDSAVTVLGGDAAVDGSGNITMGNDIGGTGKSTIDDAIGYAAQGWNLGSNGDTPANVAPGDSVDLSPAGSNLEITQNDTGTSHDIEIALADKIQVGSNGGTNPVTIDGDNGTIGGLTNKTWASGQSPVDGQAATENQLSDLEGSLTNAGLDFVGNDNNTIHKNLGDQLAIVGGNSTAGSYSADNLKTVKTGSGQLEIQMADNPAFTGVDLSDGTNTVHMAPDSSGNLKVDDGSGNPVKITNVADGTGDHDAVTYGQVKQPLEFAGDTGNNLQPNLGDTVTVAGGETNKTKLTATSDKNIGVVADKGNNTLNVRLAKDLSGIDSLMLTNGPKLTGNGGDLDVGGGKVTNLADGDINPNSSDAVNGSQLYDVQQTANKGWNVGVNGDPVAQVKPGDNVDFSTDGSNLSIAKTDSAGQHNLTVALSDNLDLTSGGSITTGNSVLDNSGLTVDDGTNNTVYGPNGIDINGGDVTLTDSGLDNGGNTITGVGDGAINSSSDEAINGSQLKAGNDSLANDVLGGDAKYDGNTNSWDMGNDIGGTGQSTIDDAIASANDAANAGWNVYDGAGNHNNIGPDGKVTFDGDSNLTVTESGNDNDATVQVALNKDINIDSVTTGNSVLDNSGLTITDGSNVTSVTSGGTNVTDGTNTTDYGPNGIDINGGDVTLTDSGLDNGGNTITGVGDGAINSSSDEAINGSQLKAGNDSLADDVLGGDAKYDGNTNSWDMGNDIGGTGQSTIDDAIASANDAANAGWNVYDGAGNHNNIGPDGKVTFDGDSNLTVTESGNDNDAAVTVALNKQIDLGATGSVTTGNSVLDNSGLAVDDGSGNKTIVDASGLTIANGPEFTSNNISADGQQIHDVAVGTANEDAVNVSQLGGVTDALGGGAGVDSNGDITAPTYNLPDAANPGDTKDYHNVGDALTGLYKSGLNFKGDDSTVVHRDLGDTLNINGGESDATKLSSGDNIGVVANNHGDGVNVQLAKNLTDLESVEVGGIKVNGDGDDTIGGLSNTTFDPNNFTSGQAATEDQLKVVSDTANAGWNVSTNGKTANATNVGPGDTVDFSNNDGNIVVAHNGTNVTVDLADDITVKNVTADSVTTGNSTLDTNGLTVDDGTNSTSYGADGMVIDGGPSVTSSGIDAGGKKITNVAAGTEGSDAVNLDQLNEATSSLADDITQKGMNFAGNEGDDVHRDLGQTLAIKGEATTSGDYSGANVKTTTSDGAVNIQIAESPKFGDVTINDGGTGKITGVAAGNIAKGSTDAVNGDQIYQLQQTANAGWNLLVDGKDGSKVAPADSVNFEGSDGNIRITKGDKDGTHDLDFRLSKDVVIDNSLTVGGNTKITGNGLTIKDGPSITSNGIDAGGKRITHVAPGVEDDDAVTVGQVNKALGGISSDIDSLHKDIRTVGRNAYAGIASAMAMGNLGQPYDPGQSAGSIGYGTYHGQSAMALGVSTITDSGRYMFKLSASENEQGHYGVATSATIFW